MQIDRDGQPFQVRTEERDGCLVLAMSGDLALETAAIVIATLGRAGDAVHAEIILDPRELSVTGPGTASAPMTADVLAGVRERRAPPARQHRRRLPARCRSSRGWSTPGIV